MGYLARVGRRFVGRAYGMNLDLDAPSELDGYGVVHVEVNEYGICLCAGRNGTPREMPASWLPVFREVIEETQDYARAIHNPNEYFSAEERFGILRLAL